jgi:omega-amidase
MKIFFRAGSGIEFSRPRPGKKGLRVTMQDLTITLIQSDLYWEDPWANQQHFERLIEESDSTSDLIVLPEMFSTGFSMRAAELAQEMTGQTVQWLRQAARKRGVDITGSLIISEKGAYYNRLVWATPDNRLFFYDKKHLFRFAGEDKVYTPGREHLTVTLKGWRIRPFICYDLRFPIWTRNLGDSYDLALFAANWPAGRAAHFRALLIARAIENQCYAAGLNRIGRDGNQLIYSGDSMVVNPEGEVVFDAHDQPCAAAIRLSAQRLIRYRRDFPAWMDADSDMVKPYFSSGP